MPRLYAEAPPTRGAGVQRWIQPRPWWQLRWPWSAAEAARPVADDPRLKPLRTLPATIPAAEQAGLRERARAIVQQQVIPARGAFLRFVEQEYSPRAPTRLGAASLSGGRAYYESRVRYHTTTRLTPDQIHDLGQREVRRIRAEMDTVMREAGWTGSFPDFLRFLRTDPSSTPEPRELLEGLGDRQAADYQCPSFRHAAATALRRHPTPREVTQPPGRTTRLAEDGQAGAYLVNTGTCRRARSTSCRP